MIKFKDAKRELAKNQKDERIQRRLKETEAKMYAKNQFAAVNQQKMFENQQMKSFQNRLSWEDKMNRINNLKDVEEFKRGLKMAEICFENERFALWKYLKC